MNSEFDINQSFKRYSRQFADYVRILPLKILIA